MRAMIITVPCNPTPTTFPPFGALSIINYARRRCDYEFDFFNIDFHRPAYGEVLDRIEAYRPDVLGISAVVSTSYAFTKQVATDVKKILPDTLIVAGGNLCASAEILLQRASVDICVLGEGERVFLNVLRRAEVSRNPADYRDIIGLALLDQNGEMIDTGYEAPLLPGEIWDVDWVDIEKDGSFDHYFPLLLSGPQKKQSTDEYACDNQARIGFLTIAKGCVARCTFCHRWDRGIRHIPIEIVMKRMRFLQESYNVRYFRMVAETFGSDKRWLNEFLEQLKTRNVLWDAGGVRTSAVTPDLIERMKQVGCVSLTYGNETGSSKMLELMEKKVSLQDNYNATRWTAESGLASTVQLVVGMPGESCETIQETIEYCKFATAENPEQDPRQISINYAQALPGTPLYEYARIHGLLGGVGLESEEGYLLRISDRPAADPQTFVNFTEHSRLRVLSWNYLIRIEVRCSYIKEHGAGSYFSFLKREMPSESRIYQRASGNIDARGRPGILLFLSQLMRFNFDRLMDWYPEVFFHFRAMLPGLVLIHVVRQYGFKEGLRLLVDCIGVGKRMSDSLLPLDSLRKIVAHQKKEMSVVDSPSAVLLRSGR